MALKISVRRVIRKTINFIFWPNALNSVLWVTISTRILKHIFSFTFHNPAYQGIHVNDSTETLSPSAGLQFFLHTTYLFTKHFIYFHFILLCYFLFSVLQ